MKIRMSIKSKMLLYILTTSVVIFLFSIGYSVYKTRVLVINDSKNLALSVTEQNALDIETSLKVDLTMLETLSDVFVFNRELEEEKWKSLFASMAKRIFSSKDNFYGFSASWEEIYYKEGITENNTRYFYHLQKDNGKVVESSSIKNLVSRVYQNSKAVNKSVLLDPTRSTVNGVTETKVYLSSPIQINKKFVGYVVGDFSTQSFRKVVNSIKPYENTKGYLLSNQGIIVSHPVDSLIGDSIIVCEPHFESQFEISRLIKRGKPMVFKGTDEKMQPILFAIAPIQVGEHKAPWALVLTIPVNEILVEANRAQIISLIVAILGIILISLIIYFRANSIGVDLNKTTLILEKLSLGDVENIEDLNLNRGDEIDVMINSVNALSDSLNRTSDFAEQIGAGHLDAKFTPLSEKDKLGNSLINMQQNLIIAKTEQEKMRLEDEKNAWTTTGLAKFGDIIRSNNDNIEKLSYTIVQNLVDYLGASMGALFVGETEDEEMFYTAKAAVAYERKKIINEKIKTGEGLVGRCIFEKMTIYLKDIPQGYISIKSGMGDANPNVLLLVPLIYDGKVFGVVELASFKEFEDHKIAFVEKLAESIASTLSSAQINQHTVQLLQQSKMQSEELAAQEEEMRQNMEELQATQEEAIRRENEMIGIIHMIDNAVYKVEYDINGSIITASEKYIAFLNTSTDKLLNKTVKDEYKLLGVNKDTDGLWSDLMAGIPKSFKQEVVISNEKYTIEEHYEAIILPNESKASKVLKLSYLVS